jgi:hypothetical protein
MERDLPTDKNYLITETDFLGRLHVRVHMIGSQKAAAAAWGMSESYLSDVLTNRRAPGPAICESMGYERVVMYREICHHEWTGQQRGGDPVDAGSTEWVEYCKLCGMKNGEG